MTGQLITPTKPFGTSRKGARVGFFPRVGPDMTGLVFESVEGFGAHRTFVRSVVFRTARTRTFLTRTLVLVRKGVIFRIRTVRNTIFRTRGGLARASLASTMAGAMVLGFHHFCHKERDIQIKIFPGSAEKENETIGRHLA